MMPSWLVTDEDLASLVLTLFAGLVRVLLALVLATGAVLALATLWTN